MAVETATPPHRGPAEVWRRATGRVFHRLYVDVGRGSTGTLFVAGSGRSGTTWVAELLNHDNAYRYMFEPFHPDEQGAGRWFPPRTYARPEEGEPRIDGPLRLVLEGRVRDPWTDQYNRRPVARRRLVKDVWANLLLGRIHRAFPEVRILLVLRHPFAVASSQLNTGWNWRTDPAAFFGQAQLMEDHLAAFSSLLRETTDPFDRHVAAWCVENVVPLRQFAPGQVHVAFFEHLRRAPDRELPPLFAALGRPWDPRVLDRVDRPSALARQDRAVGAGRDPVEDWMAGVTAERLRRGTELVARFGLDRIYGPEPMPRVAAGGEAVRIVPSASTG